MRSRMNEQTQVARIDLANVLDDAAGNCGRHHVPALSDELHGIYCSLYRGFVRMAGFSNRLVLADFIED